MTGATGNRDLDLGSLRLPAYTLVSLSAELSWSNGLEVVAYVKNLFDASPKLAIDRERGSRARFGYLIGQPRTIGLRCARVWGRATCRASPPAPRAAAASGSWRSRLLAAASATAAPPPPPASGERG